MIVTVCAALAEPTFCAANVNVEGDSVGGGEKPVPLSDTVPAPVTLRVAIRGPVNVGLKVTLIVQLAPAARVVPHVPPAMPVGRANSVVVNETPIGWVTTPGLLTITACAALVVFTFCAAKVSEVGDSVGGGVAPVPLRATVPTPVTVRVAVREPSAVGLNLTLMVQFPPTGKLVVQVPPAVPLGRTNSVPEIVIVRAWAVVPEFVSVTASGALRVPMFCGANVSPVGVIFTRAKDTNSTAPMSNPPPCGRAVPKMSWFGAPVALAALIAGEPDGSK